MYAGWNYAKLSVRFREVSIFSPAGIPVFPLKALIPITGVLLLFRGSPKSSAASVHPSGTWPPRLHDVEETESVIMHEQQYQRERGEAVQPVPGHKETGA